MIETGLGLFLEFDVWIVSSQEVSLIIIITLMKAY